MKSTDIEGQKSESLLKELLRRAEGRPELLSDGTRVDFHGKIITERRLKRRRVKINRRDNLCCSKFGKRDATERRKGERK